MIKKCVFGCWCGVTVFLSKGLIFERTKMWACYAFLQQWPSEGSVVERQSNKESFKLELTHSEERLWLINVLRPSFLNCQIYWKKNICWGPVLGIGMPGTDSPQWRLETDTVVEERTWLAIVPGSWEGAFKALEFPEWKVCLCDSWWCLGPHLNLPMRWFLMSPYVSKWGCHAGENNSVMRELRLWAKRYRSSFPTSEKGKGPSRLSLITRPMIHSVKPMWWNFSENAVRRKFR